MKLMEHIKRLLGCASEPAVNAALQQKIDHAIQVADELKDTSAAVNRKLETYLKADKPFVAMLIDIQNEHTRKVQEAQWDRE